MRETVIRSLKDTIYLSMITLIILLTGITAHSGEPEGKGVVANGETQYSLIEFYDITFISTSDGRFLINEQTRIFNNDGSERDRFICPPMPSKARIKYQNINDTLIAREIWVRELSPEERARLKMSILPQTQ